MIAILLGALAIGLTLGLLGSGGSILTVPTLVYFVGHDEKAAIAESLAVVGVISLLGAVPYALARQIDWRSVLLFGVPGMIGTYGGAWLSKFVPGAVQLVLFAIVMLLAAALMFRGARRKNGKDPDSQSRETTDANSEDRKRPNAFKIAAEGIAVGVLTGLVGVGGGFLIVPALALLGGLPMRIAVGTSLIVIAMKSAAGFYKYLGVLDQLGSSVDWTAIALFAVVGSVATLAGAYLGSRLHQQTLRRAFSAFLIVMGAFVLFREVPHVLHPEKVAEAHVTTPNVRVASSDAAIANAGTTSIGIQPSSSME